MSPDALINLAIITAVSLLAMFGVWLRQLKTQSITLVDVVWTAGCFIAPLLLLALGNGDDGRRWLLAAMVFIWGGRLILHLIPRLNGPEDSRYAAFRQQVGAGWNSWALKFCLFQGILISLFSFTAAVAADAQQALFQTNIFGVLDILGVSFFVVGMGLGWLADRQLTTFKASNQNDVCDRGLWAWSRHPNYFGEWLCQIGMALIAAAAGWWAITVPSIELLLLFYVTGIPPAERQALARRGDVYRDYQRRVSAFFPWPPKK